MRSRDLLPARISCRAPLLGRFARSAAVRELSTAAGNGDPAAVRALSRAFRESAFPDVKAAARDFLSMLTAPEAVETFCDCMLESGDPGLLSIARECGYLPRSEEKRALFFFLSGQTEAWQELDPLEGHPLLVRALLASTPDLRRRALACARERGMVSLFRALIHRPEAAGWLPDDWRAHIELFRREAQWDEMYALLFLAPLSFVVEAVHSLRGSGWKPPSTDLLFWKELVSLVPDRWGFPDPPQASAGILSNPGTTVERAEFSPGGAHLATLSSDGTLCQWSLPAGLLVSTTRLPGGRFTTLAYSPDGHALAAGGDDGTIRLVRAGNGMPVRELRAHGAPVTSIAFSQGGNTFLSAGSDGCICTWTWPECKEEDRRYVEGSAVTAIAIYGGIVASGSRDGKVLVWKSDGGYVEIQEEGAAIRDLFFSGRGACLAGFDNRGTLRVWNSRDGALISLFPSASRRFIAGCATRGGDFATLATDEHTAVVLSVLDGAEVLCPEVPGQGITSLAMDPEGSFLLAGCRDGYLHLWSIPDKKRLTVIKAHPGQVRLLAVNGTGTGFISAGSEGSVRLRALPGGELLTVMQGPGTAIHCLAATPTGDLIACGSEGGILKVWETESWQLVHWHNLFCGRINCLVLHPSGTLAACGDAQGRISLWDIGSGSLCATLEGHEGAVHALAVNREGSLLASGGWDGVVRVWSLPGKELVVTLGGHESAITSLAFSPAGRFLVSGSHDRSAIVWDLETRGVHTRICGHSHVVSCLGITGDGRTLATGSWDRTVRLWDLPSGEQRGKITGHSGKVRSLSLHPDGSVLVSSVDGGGVSIWALPGGELIRNRVVRADARNGTCLIPARHMVAAAGKDGSLHLLRLPWTTPMCQTTPEDIAYVQACLNRGLSPGDEIQWKFLERLLAGKFRNSIAYGGSGMPAGPYDIEVVEEPERDDTTSRGVRIHAV